MTRYVYSPCDDSLLTHWNAKPVKLEPNAIFSTPHDDLAEKLVKMYGNRGVCEVGSDDLERERDAVNAAEDAYKAFLLRTDGQIVQDAHDQATSAKAVGLATLGESLHVSAAKERLKKHGLLKKAKLILLALLLLPGVAQAQTRSATRYASILYDLDATSTTYCRMDGPFAGDRVSTSGSSTTISEATTGRLPFADLSSGDVVFLVDGAGTQYQRVLNAAPSGSGASITVSEAVDLSNGATFTWYQLSCGTAATSGWVSVSGYLSRTAIFQLDQYTGDGNGLDISLECKGSSPLAQPVQVWPDNDSAAAVRNLTAAGLQGRRAVSIPEPWAYCRWGALHNTADDGTDTGGDEEQITAFFELFSPK